MTTIQSAALSWLGSVSAARSNKTYLTYKCAMAYFTDTLRKNGMPASKTPINELSERSIIWLLDDLKSLSPASEVLYLTGIRLFYKFIMAEDLAAINIEKVDALVKMRMRRPGKRLPQFSYDSISRLIDLAEKLPISKEPTQKLIDLRDCAMLLFLPGTGLRIHEALKLTRGDVNWEENYLIVIGKGDKQALVRISTKSMNAIKKYLSARASIDGASGIHLTSLPIFARHDPGAGKRVLPITTKTGRQIVHSRVLQLLGPDETSKITPHSFRHYFVSQILRNTNGNLKLAQELARHESIEITQRYAHLSDQELDRGYYEAIEKGNAS